MTNNSEFDAAAAQNSAAGQADAPGPVGRPDRGTRSETAMPACHPQQCHQDSAHPSGQGDGEDLEKRFRFLLHYLEFHGGLNSTVQAQAIDETLFWFLSEDPVFQDVHRAVETRLVAAYNARTGPYAIPE
ncbi:hypothetical protein [Kitasatospora sp. NBC_01302]|uniref:hypothetical protein n=1 Tax=Kitasatospora sp. NBC_01302 TaxID=2903575 RepID=UPI002E13CE9E|nr:hypothetical protein OG294_40765 [Kitasatospora sp. NBC_01302]